MNVPAEFFSASIEPIQAARIIVSAKAYPYRFAFVFIECSNGAPANAGRVLPIILIDRHRIAIIFCQSVSCAEPHKTKMILEHAEGTVFRKPIGYSKMLKGWFWK